MIVDSHCHLDRLDLSIYDGQLSNALDAAWRAGVGHILSVSVTLAELPNLLTIASTYPNISLSAGLHPHDTMTDTITSEQLIAAAQHSKVVALGETGLDYINAQPATMIKQQQQFVEHIHAARHVKKPLIIHTRQAGSDTIALMKTHRAYECSGVMHCFTDSWEIARQALDQDFYISLSGIITFKNAQELREVVRRVPIDRLLIETDAPYLAPHPHRGQPNQPAYVRYVAEYLSEYLRIDYARFAAQITANFFNLFRTAVAEA